MKRTFILLLLFIFPFISYSQKNDILINENYNGTSFKILVEEMEKTYPVHFFYSEGEIDTLTIVQKQVPITLEDLLKQNLTEKGIEFFLDKSGNVIVTYNYKIDKTLPVSFLMTVVKKDFKENVSQPKSDFLKEEEKKNGTYKSSILKIGNPAMRNSGTTATISGTVKELETGEPIIGAIVFDEDTKVGAVTDVYGYYVLSLPKGNHELLVKFVGRRDSRSKIILNDNGRLDFNLEEEILQLKGVVITAEKEHNVKGLQVGMDKLEISTIKQIPSSMGEVDLLKTALLLPGVQTIGEGASGFNVRGGSTDQNLVLIDESPIFNTSHLFGFFSVFNADVVKEFRLYKSGIPAKYGGRISSVFDVTVKNGNKKEVSGSGGISPITSRLMIEGPLIKEKASFLIAGRSTYSDWILKKIERPEIQNSSASFYDLNTKISYDMNENNSFMISGYHSHDYFKLNSDTTYNYENWNATLSWKHSFSKKMYGIFSGVYSRYDYNISSDDNPYNAFDISFFIDYKEAKADFSYFINNNHSLNFGINSIYYTINPGSQVPIGSESVIKEKKLAFENGLESGLYINDEIRVNERLSVDAGLRYSMFFVVGPRQVYEYISGAMLTESSRIDTTVYSKNSIVKTYHGPEVRISGRYKTGKASSVKLSYNHNYQYLHMLSNTVAISPTDVWKMFDQYIPPIKGDQFALGFYKNLKNNTIEASIEVYYKIMKDVLEYKPGAELMLNPDIETDVLFAKGKAYGAEFLIRKKYGKLNGWVSYTYSSAQHKADSRFFEERINNGEYFPADHDKPHDFTLVSNYKYSRRISLSNNLTYSTGRPITMPVAKYMFRGRELVHYTQRNEYRIPDYFRWDISLNLEGNLKSKKLAHSSLSLGVYNVTGRKNVYSIYFISDPENNVKGYKLSIFAQPIYTISYNFKF